MIKVDGVVRKMLCAGGVFAALLAVSGCATGVAKVEGKIGVVDRGARSQRDERRERKRKIP